MTRAKHNPYSTNLAILRDYLKRGFDPYDYANMFEVFYDEMRDGEYPDWFDPNDPWDRTVDMSKDDKKDFQDWALDQAQDAFTPSTAFFTFERVVPRQTWLIHKTNDAVKIIKEGFACGADDIGALGLTTWIKKKKNCDPGWNFAFEADSKDARRAADGGKYGEDVILFQSSGVRAYHSGDEESQVLFWGPSVKEVIPLWMAGADGYRLDSKDDREILTAQFGDMVEWVKKHITQYRRSIAYEV